jgi:hypothetical protein
MMSRRFHAGGAKKEIPKLAKKTRNFEEAQLFAPSVFYCFAPLREIVFPRVYANLC